MPSDPSRRMSVEVTVAAPPDRVWAVLSDLSRMPDWSPELVRMLPLRRGGLRLGQQYLGVNRRGWVVWPTRNVVVAVEPGRRLSWDTPSSGARWTYELAPEGEGTRLTQSRDVPRRLSLGSRVMAPLLLGGSPGHSDELEAGMATTLERLRAEIEQG